MQPEFDPATRDVTLHRHLLELGPMLGDQDAARSAGV